MASSASAVSRFHNQVALKFQLYNSLFSSLPFYRIERTGILLSLLQNHCEEGFKRKKSPREIIEHFFAQHTAVQTEQEKIDFLFRFVQYVERQVVLFDALEDAAFGDVNDMNGLGTLKHLESEVLQETKQDALLEKLENFAVRLVLTAHPTQFYPGPVLGIINDLSKAVAENNVSQINTYLQQLGKTPFFKKQKPTPYDEAVSLIWYLENVFYAACGRIVNKLAQQYPGYDPARHQVIQMGFWPGGDRDGNPFVTSDITLRVAAALRGSIIKCYYLDIRKLKRRLTFKGIEDILTQLEERLYEHLFIPASARNLSKEDLLKPLREIRDKLIHSHNGLFVNLVDSFIHKVHLFGLYFATLDVRQDSSIHRQVLERIAGEKNSPLGAGYRDASDEEKLRILAKVEGDISYPDWNEGVEKDTLSVIRAIKEIQAMNGQEGCNRYIISQCGSARQVMEVYGLFRLCGWKASEINVDIVPLFETIDDLTQAAEVMRSLYSLDVYREHLKNRGNKQTVMLGFSDGTKDGGYLMANWGIYKAKESLTAVSKEFGIDVLFFDGRGGPPARGGGKTHKFYSSLGKNISGKEIQITVQGQTVSSSFGTIDAAQFNVEQLLHAGVSNELFNPRETTLSNEEESLLQELANESFQAYKMLKDDPRFLDYLSAVSPLRYYSDTNIGSRPAKRNSSGKLTLKDLRAIPYVGAWSQLKQNVTGYYGIGTALQALEAKGRFQAARQLYRESLFFKTLIDNCEMAMKKCYFPLTEYLSNHPEYSAVWNMIYHEYELTQKYLSRMTGNNELMFDYPVDQLSIQMRDRIVLPLLSIQQYAIQMLQDPKVNKDSASFKALYEKLITRSSFGIINASRNSA